MNPSQAVNLYIMQIKKLKSILNINVLDKQTNK